MVVARARRIGWDGMGWFDASMMLGRLLTWATCLGFRHVMMSTVGWSGLFLSMQAIRKGLQMGICEALFFFFFFFFCVA